MSSTKKPKGFYGYFISLFLMVYIKKGLKRTLCSIRAHKLMFILLIILQVIFLVAFFSISINYNIKILNDNLQILNHTNEITAPLQNLNYNLNSAEDARPLMKQMLSVYKNYRSMIKNVIYYLLWLTGLFMIINGTLWVLTHQLLRDGQTKDSQIKDNQTKKGKEGELGKLGLDRELIQKGLKFVILTLILFGPIMIFIYYILSSLLKLEILISSFTNMIKIMSYLFLILYYFFLVGSAFVNVKSWKKFLKIFYIIAIKKIHWILPVLLTNLALISLSLYLVYVFIDPKTFIPMIFFSIIFILILVLTRIFWVACLQELANEKNNPRH